MRVFLVRHAEAASGEPDELRPLTAAGRATAEALGEQLARHKLDAVVSSPLLRARQTAAPIAKAANLDAEIEPKLAPGADAQSLRDALAGRGETVVAVGHQPDCAEIVLELTGDRVRFAPGAVVEIELDA
jgi:phosphohistidine phosphatase